MSSYRERFLEYVNKQRRYSQTLGELRQDANELANGTFANEQLKRDLKAAMHRQVEKWRDELANDYEYRMSSYPLMFMPDKLPSVRILDLEEPQTEPQRCIDEVVAVPRCVWCNEYSISRDGRFCSSPFCYEYYAALEERLSGGAHDCPEERDSVKRWVDAQKPQRVCAECKARPLPDDGVTQLCGDCVGAGGLRLRAKTNHPETPDSWEADSGPDWEYP